MTLTSSYIFLHRLLILFIFPIVGQVLHMDRNDYYGGESTSLNLIQARNMLELWWISVFCTEMQLPRPIMIWCLFKSYCIIYSHGSLHLYYHFKNFFTFYLPNLTGWYDFGSFGKGLGEMINPQLIWVPVEITMLTWYRRFLSISFLCFVSCNDDTFEKLFSFGCN